VYARAKMSTQAERQSDESAAPVERAEEASAQVAAASTVADKSLKTSEPNNNNDNNNINSNDANVKQIAAATDSAQTRDARRESDTQKLTSANKLNESNGDTSGVSRLCATRSETDSSTSGGGGGPTTSGDKDERASSERMGSVISDASSSATTATTMRRDGDDGATAAGNDCDKPNEPAAKLAATLPHDDDSCDIMRAPRDPSRDSGERRRPAPADDDGALASGRDDRDEARQAAQRPHESHNDHHGGHTNERTPSTDDIERRDDIDPGERKPSSVVDEAKDGKTLTSGPNGRPQNAADGSSSSSSSTGGGADSDRTSTTANNNNNNNDNNNCHHHHHKAPSSGAQALQQTQQPQQPFQFQFQDPKNFVGRLGSQLDHQHHLQHHQQPNGDDHLYYKPATTRRLSYLQSLLLRRWPCLALTICIMSSLLFGILLSGLTIYLVHGVGGGACNELAARLAAAGVGTSQHHLRQQHHSANLLPHELIMEPPSIAASLDAAAAAVVAAGAGGGPDAPPDAPLTHRQLTDAASKGVGSPVAAFQRLSGSVVPKHYELFIWPHIAEPSFHFNGSVEILITCKTATSNITLHSLDLTIDEASLRLTKAGGPVANSTRLELAAASQAAPKVSRLSEDKQLQYSIVHLESALEPGQDYLLRMDFVGTLNDDLAGFYKIKYERQNSSEIT
jgi:hypothetical protein